MNYIRTNMDFNEDKLGLESFEDGQERADRMIEDLSLDIRDIMNGKLKDMDHADAVWKVLDKMNLLEEVTQFFETEESVELINDKSMEEIQKFMKDCDEFVEKFNKFKENQGD